MRVIFTISYFVLCSLTAWAQGNYIQNFENGTTDRSFYTTDCYSFSATSLTNNSSAIEGISVMTSQLSNENDPAIFRSPAVEFLSGGGTVEFDHKMSAKNGTFRYLYLVIADPNGVLKPDTVFSYDYRSGGGSVDASLQQEKVGVDVDGVFQIEWHFSGKGGNSRGILDNIVTDAVIVSTASNGCSTTSASSGGNAFPVEWAELNAEWAPEGARISWSTASEQNNDFFEIERSNPEGEYHSIGEVAAAGNSNETQHYQFSDFRAGNQGQGTIFYRIKQVDLDGSFSYSRVMSVVPTGQPTLALSPNPASTHVRVDLLHDDQPYEVSIINYLGNEIYRHQEQLTDVVEIPIQNFPTGVYWIKASNRTHQLSSKLWIQ
ncbi:MAG: T9SS type A sorting domain-containing protein [Bacteroidota bacterium]